MRSAVLRLPPPLTDRLQITVLPQSPEHIHTHDDVCGSEVFKLKTPLTVPDSLAPYHQLKTLVWVQHRP